MRKLSQAFVCLVLEKAIKSRGLASASRFIEDLKDIYYAKNVH